MKAFIMSCSLLVMPFVFLGQETLPVPSLESETYFSKATKQKKIATVLNGVGAALLFVSMLIVLDDLGGLVDPENKDQSSLSNTLLYAGLGFVSAGTTLFIISRHNRKKAINLSLQALPLNSVKNQMVFQQMIPFVKVKIDL